jgi:hypothetical protein
MLDADTLKKLEQRQQELADIFIDETDATKWPGTEDRTQRGDRYWFKRNAGATATLIVKIQSMLDMTLKQPPMGDPKEPVPGDEPSRGQRRGARRERDGGGGAHHRSRAAGGSGSASRRSDAPAAGKVGFVAFFMIWARIMRWQVPPLHLVDGANGSKRRATRCAC